MRVKEWPINHPFGGCSFSITSLFTTCSPICFAHAWLVYAPFDVVVGRQAEHVHDFYWRAFTPFFLGAAFHKSTWYAIHTIRHNVFRSLSVSWADLCSVYKGDVLTMDIMRARPSRPFMKQWKWTEPLAAQPSWPASMTRWRSSRQTTLTCSTSEATPCGETPYSVCAAADPSVCQNSFFFFASMCIISCPDFNRRSGPSAERRWPEAVYLHPLRERARLQNRQRREGKRFHRQLP